MTTSTAQVIRDIQRLNGNDVCADCDMPKPLFVNMEVGVLLCESCAQLHKHLVPNSRCIKITSRDVIMPIQLLADLSTRGNWTVNQLLEELVPPGYLRPKSFDAPVLREQWVLDKYVRKTFMVKVTSDSVRLPFTPADYQADHKEGYLWKRGKNKETFQKRLFILDADEKTLRYYNQENKTSAPKGTFRLAQLNVLVLPQKIGNVNGMQLTYDVDHKTRRNVFVYAATGKEVVEWLSCIRSTKLKHLALSRKGQTQAEISDMLTHYFVKEGWMQKTGPDTGSSYRKRWFTLDGSKLFYAKGPLEAFPGSIQLGSRAVGYDVLEMGPDGSRAAPKGCSTAFTLVTPQRKYCFAALDYRDREDWIRWLRVVIGQ